MSGEFAQPLDPSNALYPPGVRDVLARAHTGWLKNTEVCDLLVHFRTYGLSVQRHPPHRPAGGAVFLFDRRAVRFFRKDGHSWRKKADGKTVRETHEKLKVGNVDMLNCYYAHGDEAEDLRLQRRCYWLLESDEDIVLVHYLSADQLVGGPRSKGVAPRAAVSYSTSNDDSEEGTTSSHGSGLAARNGQSLESPFRSRARAASAQSREATGAAAQARAAGMSGRTPPPHGGPAPGEEGAMLPPPRPRLGARGRAFAAAAAGHPSYGGRGGIGKNSSALIEGSCPLLPSMSLDSFLNIIPDGLPAASAAEAQLVPSLRMQRQGSDPLRLESLANQWDEEGAITLMHGHLPSLHMNSTLQASSIPMLDAKELAEGVPPLPGGTVGGGPSLRVPSGAEGYAQFLRHQPLGAHPPGLKTLSGVLPRMHVAVNSDRSSMDFENNRSFTVGPVTPGIEGGSQSPAFTSGLAVPDSWDAGTRQPSWDAMAHAPASVPVPRSPQPPPRLLVHQGGSRPPQPAPTPTAFYSPFATGAAHAQRQHQQQQHQQSPLANVDPAVQQDIMARQLSAQLAMQQQLLAQQQPASEALDDARRAQQGGTRAYSAGPSVPSDMSGGTVAMQGVARQGSEALRQRGRDSPAATPTQAWVPDTGAEDVGGSKAARRPHGPLRGALAVEAELNSMQASMLAAWQPPPPGQGPAPLGAQLGGWQAQLEGLEARALGHRRQRSAGVASSEDGAGLDGDLSPGDQQEAPLPPPAFKVTGYSPEWDTTAGGAKLLLTGSLLPGAPSIAQRGPLYLLFGTTEVPATVLQPGVLKATVPPHAPGSVRLAVSLGDGIPRSRQLRFEYRVPPPPQASDDDGAELQLSDRELQLRLVQLLVAGRGGPSSATGSPELPSHTSSYAGGGSGQQQQHQPQEQPPPSSSPTAGMPDPTALDDEQRTRYLTLLLQREVQRYANQAQRMAAQGSPNALNVLPPSGLGLLHLFAALGYEWGVTALLLAAAEPNLRDAWGRTPLHWAAARGHEAAVTALLVRGASPSLLTWGRGSQAALPASSADLAARCGHAGIAAFLAEAALEEQLQQLKPEGRRDALAAAAAAAEDEGDSSRQGAGRKRNRHVRSLYPGDANSAAKDRARLEPAERAAAAAATLSAAYGKVAQRKAACDSRRDQLRQREQDALARIEGWANTWQQAEGRILGAAPADVEYFRHLVACAARLGAALRLQLLEGQAQAGSSTSGDACSSSAGQGVDPAGHPDYPRALEAAVSHVAALDRDEGAAEMYARLVAAKAAGAGSPTAKFSRPDEDADPLLEGLTLLSPAPSMPLPIAQAAS